MGRPQVLNLELNQWNITEKHHKTKNVQFRLTVLTSKHLKERSFINNTFQAKKKYT